MFYNRLRLEFKKSLILQNMKSVKETFLLALELGSSLRAPLIGSLLSKSESGVSMCEAYGHHANKCIKCSKCGEFGPYDYQCPSKSQHIDNVCKLMTLIIQKLSRMSTFLLRLLMILLMS